MNRPVALLLQAQQRPEIQQSIIIVARMRIAADDPAGFCVARRHSGPDAD